MRREIRRVDLSATRPLPACHPAGLGELGKAAVGRAGLFNSGKNDNVLPCAEGEGRTTFFPVPKSGSAINGWPAVGTAHSFLGRGTVSARAA